MGKVFFFRVSVIFVGFENRIEYVIEENKNIRAEWSLRTD